LKIEEFEKKLTGYCVEAERVVHRALATVELKPDSFIKFIKLFRLPVFKVDKPGPLSKRYYVFYYTFLPNQSVVVHHQTR
jgi:hypothetical protein